jgi:chaperone LolA
MPAVWTPLVRGGFLRTVVIFLAALLMLSTTTAGAGEFSGLESYFQSIHTLKGVFDQKTLDENGELIEEVTGTFAISRPDRFDWRYEEPYRQRIVADGRWLWVYDMDLDQVTVRPLDEVLGVGPALLLSGDYDSLQDAFAIERRSNGWLRLTPKKGDWDFQSVRLRMQKGVPTEVEVNDGMGQITRLRLSKLVRNPELEASRFHFEPPSGVDVIAPPGFKRGGD